MARLTASKAAWNVPPSFARSRFHPCQYAVDVLGKRCSTQASRARSVEMSWSWAMAASFSSSTPEGEQVVALVLQRDAHRANASGVLGLTALQFRDDEVKQHLPSSRARSGQRQNVMAQPLGEQSDVADQTTGPDLGLPRKLQLDDKLA